MDPTSMSTDELIAASADLDDRTAGIFETLARITATAAGDNGVDVVVNLDGMLVGLNLTDAAVRLPPDLLAAEISHLTQQAAGFALAEGLTTLEPVAGDELLALIELVDLGEPVAPPAPRSDDDFSAIESWALPR